MHPVEPIGGGHGSVTNPRREQPATLWTWWTTQARCPHAHSDNNKRRQPFEIGSKSPTRLHEETYNSSSGYHGFLYSGGVYTTLDYPLETNGATLATGINDAGQIVGYYAVDGSSNWHSFLYSGGKYTTLDDPLATDGTFANGINGTAQIVGIYVSAGSNHGFLANFDAARAAQ